MIRDRMYAIEMLPIEITPLTPVQEKILNLLGHSTRCYTRLSDLAHGFSKHTHDP